MHYKYRLFSIIAIILGLCCLSLSGIAAKQQPIGNGQNNRAALITIKGAIGPAIQNYVVRGIASAVKQQARVVILQMDTPGGLSKSMRGIIKAIIGSPIPVITYVSPSGARAASAGTYILYASHVAAMAPGTNLGAATPVNITNPGAKPNKDKKNQKDTKQKDKKTATQQKAINDARAYIRALAQLRGRNVKWAEKAVTEAASLSAEEAVKQNVVDYVASDISQLLAKANGRKVLVQGRPVVLQTKNLVVYRIAQDWRTKFLAVITDPSVAYILLMIGFYGLFFEFVNPGMIIPGVAGAICLMVALYAFQLLPINYAGLGLIVLGMVFIVAEAFVPSVGALGIGGVVSLVVGSIMLLRTDVPGFSLPLMVIFSVAAISVLVFIGILTLAFRSRRRKIVSGAEGLIGQFGTIELRNERLWVNVNGELWKYHCGTECQPGQTVEVMKLDGLKLHVQRQDKES